MKVELLFAPSHKDALNVLYSECRQCYMHVFVGDRFPFHDVSDEEKAKLLKRVMASGHLSVIEHISFTFAIGDFSRASAQQLTRHRLASYSMSSQRYCNVRDVGVVVPSSISAKPLDFNKFNNIIDSVVKWYTSVTERDEGAIPVEDARAILPINWGSHLVVTMNCRQLLHFFEERICMNSQKEIRKLAVEMLKKCREVLPEIFESAGPKCKKLGYCNEGKRSCGIAPLKEEVFRVYNLFKDKV